MSDFSDYYENKIGDHMIRGQAFTPAATVYVALFSASDALETNAPTAELTGSNYARVAVTMSAFSSGASSNSADVDMPVASGDWLQATHFAIVDHASATDWGTGVNVLMWKAVTTPRTCLSGDQLKFLATTLTVTIT